MKRTFSSIFSIVLVLALVFSTLPATVFAEHDTTLGTSGTITVFASLDEQTESQYYGVGEKQLDELDLPDSLIATLLEDDVASSGTTSQISEIAIPVLEWQSTPAYDPDVLGTYVFTPTLDLGDYALDSGAQPPSVTVAIIERQGIVPAAAGDALDNALTGAGFTTAWSDSDTKVTVTGTATTTTTLTLTIPAGVTVDWQAVLTSSADKVIELTGDNGATSVFKVSAPANLTSTASSGTNYVIYNNSTSKVNVTGGTITAGAGDNTRGIYNSLEGAVTVSGGTINGGSGTTNSYGVSNGLSGDVTVSGDAKINGGTGTTSYGLTNLYIGTVTVSGGAEINGGGVNNTGAKSYGIYNISSGGSGNVVVSGGTIDGGSGETSHGIYYSATETVTVSGDAEINGGTGTTSHGVYNNSTGAVNVTGGEINGGGTTGTGANSHGVYNNGAGTVSVSGTTTVINGGSGTNSHGVLNIAGGTVTASGGEINGGLGASSSYGIYNDGGGTINVSGCTINGGSGATVSCGVHNRIAGGTVKLSGTVTITGGSGTTSRGINSIAGTIQIGTGADIAITAGTSAIETAAALVADPGSVNFDVKGGASSSNSDILTHQTDAYKNSSAVIAKYAKISIAAARTIAVTSTGLTGLKVGQTVTGTIVYTLSNGTYAGTITAANFAVTNLPTGLSSGTVTRTSDTVVTVNITGTPTAYNASTTAVTLPTSIPQANVTGAASAITPSGTVTASAVDRGNGAAVSGVPTVNGTPTASSITVNAVTVPTNPGTQSVEYAISTTSGTAPTGGWQSDTTFSGLTAATTYYVYARTASNTNYNAGTAQHSVGISTSTPSSNTAADIQQWLTANGITGLTVAVNDSTNTVTITGTASPSPTIATLNLAIPAGVTVDWQAALTSSADKVINLTGSGAGSVFKVSAPANLTSTASSGDTYVIYNDSTSAINVTGGTITAGGGDNSHGVYNKGAAPVSVSGGTISGGTGATSHGVYNDGTGAVTVSGTSTVINGGTGATSHGVYNKGAAPASVTVTGGTINGGGKSTAGAKSYGVYNEGTGTVSVSGGTINGGSGASSYGVYNYNAGGTVELSGTVVITGGSGTTESLGISSNAGTINILAGADITITAGTAAIKTAAALTLASGITVTGGAAAPDAFTLTWNTTSKKYQNGATGALYAKIAAGTPSSNTAADIQQWLTANGITGLTVAVNDSTNTVTITGTASPSPTTATLNLAIPAGVTVDWQAALTSSADKVINLTGDNGATSVFKVSSPANLTSTAVGSNFVIFNDSTGTVDVSGGTITAGGGTNSFGIRNEKTGTVTVSGGTINGGSGTYSVGISGQNVAGIITVTGGEINGGSGTNSYGISNSANSTVNLSGTVVINGGSGTTNSCGIHNDGTVNIGTGANITITAGTAAIQATPALTLASGLTVTGGAVATDTFTLTRNATSGVYEYTDGTVKTAKYAKIAVGTPSGNTKAAIETWLSDNGITGLTVAVNDTTNTVTITGTAIPNPTNATLDLAIAAGATVDWQATLSSSADKVINLTGADATSVFKMTGGSLTSTANTGDTSVIYNSGAGTVNVSGGVINAGSGTDSTGIYNNGTGIVNVSGTAAINGGSGTDSTGIYNNGTGTVNVSGGTINGGTGTDSSYGVYNHAGGTVNLSGTVTITCPGTTDSVGINNNSGTVKIGANADVTITAGTAAIKTASALATDTSFTVKGGASSSNSDTLTLQTGAYKNVGGTTAKYAKISTAPSTAPSIAITSTGLTGLKVGQSVTGTIVYTLSNGTYTDPINAANFAVTNLPAGLSVGTATRTSDTVVTVTITGTPTTANASTTTVTIPVIPQANVTGATADITPTGTVIASAVANATSGNDSSSSGSGSGSSASSVSAPASAVSSIDDKTLGTAINSAVNAASGGTSLDVRLKNISNFTKENAAAILAKAKGKSAKVSSDVMSENSKFVEVRVTLDPALITKTVRLDGYIRESQTSMTESKFNRHFANDIMVVRLGQEGKFGQAAKIAARLDPGKFDSVSNLYFYNYDKKTNKYTRITEPKHWVDKNSYLHFYTELGGDIIISEYPLDKK